VKHDALTIATIHLPDSEATAASGARLAPLLDGGMIIMLSGDLGAGKTTLVRGCLRALGWTGPVKSPTYTLVEHYPFSSLYFYHFDFYRFTDPGEWETVGLADCFRGDSVCFVEWPERVAGLLPPADLLVTLTHPQRDDDDGRLCTLEARTSAGERCLMAMAAAADLAPPLR
jgi:tRNA threonylcarbamoyladenosine biosynthesis protein TsaE